MTDARPCEQRRHAHTVVFADGSHESLLVKADYMYHRSTRLSSPARPEVASAGPAKPLLPSRRKAQTSGRQVKRVIVLLFDA